MESTLDVHAMLDSNGRQHVQPLLDAIAKSCHRAGISANALTFTGMLVGLSAASLVLAGYPFTGFLALWLSGLIDTADGTLA